MNGRPYRGGKHSSSIGHEADSDPRFHAPPVEQCVVRTVQVPLEDARAQITVRLVYFDGVRLVYFAITFSLKLGDEWVPQCYVDTGHGSLHIHHDGIRGRENSRELLPLRSEREVGQSYETGYNAVHNRYLEWKKQGGSADA